MTSEDLPDRRTVVLLAVAIEGGLALASLGLGWVLKQPVLETVHWWDPLGFLWGLAAAVPLFALFFVLVRWPVGPFKKIKRFSDEVIRPAMMPCSLVDLAGISILAGLGEELLFRATFQGAFHRWFGVWVAVVLAAVLFGVLHAVTLTYALLATLMGVYLGLVWYWSDNLVVPIVAHAAYDFVALVYLTRGPGSELAPETDAPEMPP